MNECARKKRHCNGKLQISSHLKGIFIKAMNRASQTTNFNHLNSTEHRFKSNQSHRLLSAAEALKRTE